ncbi:MAG: hypothetical protein VCD66_08275, partial [Alphaproteobacteria bacterium]
MLAAKLFFPRGAVMLLACLWAPFWLSVPGWAALPADYVPHAFPKNAQNEGIEALLAKARAGDRQA